MIAGCFELIEELYENEQEKIDHLLPESIKDLLEKTQMNKEEKEIIHDWFTESYLITDDFCDIYDGDLTSIHMMEALAHHYVYQPQVYKMKGANIEDVLDMIPKDLADLVIEAKNDRKNSSENTSNQFDFFISYASEEKEYAQIVSGFIK